MQPKDDLVSRGRRRRLVAAGVAVTLFAGAAVATAEGTLGEEATFYRAIC